MNDTELLHPECFNIDIPKDDPFFAKFGQRCMSFVRSTPAPRFDCSFGYGEQASQSFKIPFNYEINNWFDS